jgi:hypothetical protein
MRITPRISHKLQDGHIDGADDDRVDFFMSSSKVQFRGGVGVAVCAILLMFIPLYCHSFM